MAILHKLTLFQWHCSTEANIKVFSKFIDGLYMFSSFRFRFKTRPLLQRLTLILYVVAYLDVGDMNTICQKCGAMVWYGERAQKQSSPITPDIALCCMKGNVTLPYMLEPPPLLRSLFNGDHPRSNHFISNIRSYNNLFSFTSMGGKVENKINNGAGPPQFIISGQNYHRIGSLIPSEGQRPKFCQLYIYDTDNELANRLSHFRWDIFS